MLPLERAPDLRGATAWCNVEQPIDLGHDLAGQVAVVLFFTPSCIHCREALATLALLDARFASRPVAILGVATPRDAADVRPDDVLAELDARFPVALDADAAVWNAYGCTAWPTLVLIDGTGRVRFHGCGEPDATALVGAIRTLLAEVEYGGAWGARPRVARQPSAQAPHDLVQPSGLAFDVARGELWVADARNHRLLAVDAATGSVRAVVGGMAGASDGVHPTFFSPHGLYFDVSNHRLLIADAGNHLVRTLRADGTAGTLLGTGARSYDRGGGARGVGQGLASPWGLTGAGGDLFIAMAGAHQLWSLPLDEGVAVASVGSGMRGHQDGAAPGARLAQPRALAVRADEVAFVDFDNHAVRLWNRSANQVDTLVGREAGDADGALSDARLRQPEAIVWHGDDLIVADTGNGKLKRIDRARGHVTTIGLPVPIARPVALAVDGDRLFVADRARRVIVAVELSAATAREIPIVVPRGPLVEGHVRVRANADCVLKLPLPVPDGAGVHPDVPVRVALRGVEGAPLAVDFEYEARVEGQHAVVHGVKTGSACVGRVRAELSYYTRHGQGRVGHPQHVTLEATFTLDADAPSMALWGRD